MRNFASVPQAYRGVWLAGILTGAIFALTPVYRVEATPPALAASQFQAATNETISPFGFLTGISRSGYMLGDMWGLRPWLSKYGISLAISETSEVLGNPTGGVKQ